MFRELRRDFWKLIRKISFYYVFLIVWILFGITSVYIVGSTINDCGARWTSFSEYGVQYHFFTGKCLYAD